jgi:class 3 adenylate cyclase
MESHAAPGTIQVSERAYERLRHRFELCPRGTVEVKGKGPLTGYLLLGRRSVQVGSPSRDARPGDAAPALDDGGRR